MILNKLSALVLAVVVPSTMILTACSSTPRGLDHKATRPVAQIEVEKQNAQVELFSQEVSAMVVGESRVFAQSPLGDSVTVTALPFYTSGLGEECRKAQAQYSEMSSLFTVCKTENGTWRYIAPLVLGEGL